MRSEKNKWILLKCRELPNFEQDFTRMQVSKYMYYFGLCFRKWIEYQSTALLARSGKKVTATSYWTWCVYVCCTFWFICPKKCKMQWTTLALTCSFSFLLKTSKNHLCSFRGKISILKINKRSLIILQHTTYNLHHCNIVKQVVALPQQNQFNTLGSGIVNEAFLYNSNSYRHFPPFH